MENKPSSLKTKKRKHDLVMLPPYFKGIGFFTLLICGVLALADRVKDFGIRPDQPHYFRHLMLHGILLGLLLLAASRDKEEDELTQAIRVKSMATVFITNGVIVVIQPFFTLIGDDPIVPFTAVNLMVEALVFYLLLFSFQKLMR